ncbi:MAG: quinone oxidoreductase, partial [Betaproteobacteria bacterium]|nr:quinone oxidoreductase [Betaproteobacteria bacterium]
MTNAHAVSIKQQGAPEEMMVEQIDIAAPGPGQVLIEQSAIGLNYQDVYHRSGFYPLTLPSGLGTEAAGVVIACG